VSERRREGERRDEMCDVGPMLVMMTLEMTMIMVSGC
jgi:hypothetical protein